MTKLKNLTHELGSIGLKVSTLIDIEILLGQLVDDMEMVLPSERS